VCKGQAGKAVVPAVGAIDVEAFAFKVVVAVELANVRDTGAEQFATNGEIAAAEGFSKTPEEGAALAV
jgi:hypothetical protein